MKDEYADEGSKFYKEDYNPRSDPGYRTNTYSMTDEKKHTSTVHVTLNGLDEHSVFLKDDPADHRGLLSWMSQKMPENEQWELEEAGSYGYLVKLNFSREAIIKAAEENVLRVRLEVDESSDTSGGLAVYGEKFGRYPFRPSIIITK